MVEAILVLIVLVGVVIALPLLCVSILEQREKMEKNNIKIDEKTRAEQYRKFLESDLAKDFVFNIKETRYHG